MALSVYMQAGFYSAALEMTAHVDIVMPQEMWSAQKQDFDAPKEYPTLYLLHGYSGDHTSWQRASAIERYAADLGIAVVMPGVERSWFSDTKYGYKFLTYLTKELPHFLAAHYRCFSQSRETTFVAGLSMGGYGALKLALHCPERFSQAVALSSAFDIVGRAKGATPETKGFWQGIFGDANEIENSENDVWYLAQKIQKEGKPLPKIHLSCGTEDWRIGESRKMRDWLLSLGYEVFYSEGPGDHNWGYWDEQIALALPRLLGKEAEQ